MGLHKSKNHRYLEKSQTLSPKGIPNPPQSSGKSFQKALKTRTINVLNKRFNSDSILLPKALQNGGQIKDLLFGVPGPVWANRASRGESEKQKGVHGIKINSNIDTKCYLRDGILGWMCNA